MTRPAAVCHPDRTHMARGLCNPCYRHARYHGRLDAHARRATSAGQALRLAADSYSVSIPAIIGRDRDPYLSDARTVAARLMRDHVGMTLAAIGRCLDGRHYSTVLALLDRPPGVADPVRPPVDGRTCQVAGCGRLAFHTHMCPGHRQRWLRTGRIRPQVPVRAVLADDAPVIDDPDVTHDRRLYNRAGCRCAVCRADAVSAVKLARLRPQSRPVTDALAVLRPLLDAGMSVHQIATAAGTGSTTLYSWLHGRVEVAYQRTIDRIAAVEPPEPVADRCVDCGEVPMPGGGLRCLRCFQSRARAS